MKILTLTVAFLTGMPLVLMAQVTKEDLKKLTAAGISDGVILNYVKSHGPVEKLSAEDVIELKKAGASETLLAAVLGNAAPATRPSPAPSAQAYSESPAPSTTVVYDTTPAYSPSVYYDGYYPGYYSPWYSGYYGPWLGVGFGFNHSHCFNGFRGGSFGGRFGVGFSSFGGRGHGGHR
jgi:hypothetical protein